MEVEKWKKRLKRKGPFFLYGQDKEPHTIYKWDYSTSPPKRIDISVTKNIYTVIWNDGPKTKIGTLSDYMYTRYGINTWSTLKGDTVFDLWNPACVNDASFKAMLDVRNGTSKLPVFSLDNLIGIYW